MKVLDISKSQLVRYRGYQCIIRDYDRRGVLLEWLEGPRVTYLDRVENEELLEYNEDIVWEEDGDDY